MEPNQASVEKREYFRVRTRIALRARHVSPGEFTELEEQIRGREPDRTPEADKHLIEWLDRIETKLDRLMAHAGLVDARELAPEEEQDVWLSGSGMQFQTSRTYSTGTVLLLEFELPGTTQRTVRTLARVVESTPDERDSPVAVTFVAIHERDRDAIVTHTLEVERVQIRSGMAPPRGSR